MLKKVIVISGASAGIGRATALRLARDGHALVLCARRADRLQALADEIAAGGGSALAVAGDVADASAMESLVARAVDTYGRLDVVICNAGFGIEGSVDETSLDQMHRLIEVNYLGTFHLLRAALPLFRRAARGHAIVVSSIVGKRGVPYMGAYSATKFAQVGLAECLRAEIAGSGIHVSIVYPVSTDTEFFEVLARESTVSSIAARGPRQPPEVVAGAIARCIATPVPEVYPYPKSRGLVLLNAVAPGLCDRLVQRFGRRRAVAPNVAGRSPGEHP